MSKRGRNIVSRREAASRFAYQEIASQPTSAVKTAIPETRTSNDPTNRTPHSAHKIARARRLFAVSNCIANKRVAIVVKKYGKSELTVRVENVKTIGDDPSKRQETVATARPCSRRSSS